MVSAERENFRKYEALDRRKWHFQGRFNFYDFGFPTLFALPSYHDLFDKIAIFKPLTAQPL